MISGVEMKVIVEAECRPGIRHVIVKKTKAKRLEGNM